MRARMGPVVSALQRTPRATLFASVLLGVAGGAFLILQLVWWRWVLHAHLTAFDIPPVDGAMQLINPLERMADGQRPGRDFPAFHGVGLPVLHYPIFALFGSNVHGSEIARWTVTEAAALLAPAALLWGLTQRLKPFLTMAAGLVPIAFWPFMSHLMEPRTSQLGVRAAMPLIVVAFLALAASNESGRLAGRLRRGHRLDLASGALCAIAVLIGTEHGLAITLATALVFLITPARAEALRSRARSVAVFGGAWVVALVAGAVIISGGGWADALRYALVTVPGDQFWYFGVPPNQPLTSWRVFVGTNGSWLVQLSIVATVALWLLRRRLPQSWPVLILLTYGMLSAVTNLGILAPSNFSTLGRVLVIVAAWVVVVVVPQLEIARRNPQRLALAGVALWMLTVVPASLPHAAARFDELKRVPVAIQFHSGVGLNRNWTDHINALERTIGPISSKEKPDIWSLYGSSYEAERNAMNPTGTDYIIHALGHERRDEYARRFAEQKAQWVTTPRLAILYALGGVDNYVHWLWNEHWPLFRDLLTNYTPERATPYSLIWKRKLGPGLWPAGRVQTAGPINAEGRYELPVPGPRRSRELLSVRVDYEPQNRLRALPFFGNLARYLMYFENNAAPTPVSFPPDRTSWEFPVFLRDGAIPKLIPVVRNPIPGGNLAIKRITYRKIDLPEPVIRFMLEEQLPRPRPGPAAVELAPRVAPRKAPSAARSAQPQP